MTDTCWNTAQLFSSEKHDWATPKALFDVVNREFDFKLDAAASDTNTKCATYLTETENALNRCWHSALLLHGHDPEHQAVWLNPPYGREIGKWIEKAYRESRKGCKVVVLTFCRSDTKWWNKWAMRAAEIRTIPGRITFEGAKAGAPAPSCLLVFDENRRVPKLLTQELPRK